MGIKFLFELKLELNIAFNIIKISKFAHVDEKQRITSHCSGDIDKNRN